VVTASARSLPLLMLPEEKLKKQPLRPGNVGEAAEHGPAVAFH